MNHNRGEAVGAQSFLLELLKDTTMTNIHELTKHGQSIWYDNIRRALLDSGELQALLDDGVMGVTSNPSIFEKAIAGSADYDDAILALAASEKTAEQIYEVLALEDIQRTADLLRPIYEETDGIDGYISLEVSPTLAHNTEGTLSDARRLFTTLDRPNIMIKVPATPAGIPAIETLIGEGINVNVTLMFSLAHYDAVAEAYLSGLEKLATSGGDVGKVASVASFFVSRVESAVDRALEEIGGTELQGVIAIANTKAAYARFRETFKGERWEVLAAKGARVQRPLWASTSTKNPTYPDTLYVDALVGGDTVNTVPPATLQAFLDHGKAAATLEIGMDESFAQLTQLAELGIDLEVITQKLQDDGVASFTRSFEALMTSIAEKRDKLLTEWQHLSTSLGGYQDAVDKALVEMESQKIMERIWDHDHNVWKPDPAEIKNRLGWLHIAETMLDAIPRMEDLATELDSEGYTQALLLGMGGSSLAPEVFRKTYGVSDGGLDLAVLDSTDPDAVLARGFQLDLAKTLFIVATKSGGTAETLSFFKYFYNQVVDAVGAERAGEHFIAITDPGSKLVDIAQTYHFRAVFLNDPNIGGRYSALSYFGLVPAALVGVDLQNLLDRSLTALCNCESCNCSEEGNNYGAQLGTIMGVLAKAGRDKITIVTSPAIASFGDWVEQLIAESTGKEDRGILPVVGELIGTPDVYGDDRLFVYLRLADDDTFDASIQALTDAGHPVVWLHLDDIYALGGQFFLWEMATAVAGYHLEINPFDQPNVESAKILTRKMVAEFMEVGELPSGEFVPPTAVALNAFLENSVSPGSYVALQAYLQPTPETESHLQALRLKIRNHYKTATTLGFGPRFLHSTGQLHKGDGGNGIFIQFVSDAIQDVSIPDEAGQGHSTMSFGVLKAAQALGDAQALLDAGRRVIRFDLGSDVMSNLMNLGE
jgi:transaldolase/glucose-6-phosphate isomerase